MTTAARAAGLARLVMSAAQWQAAVTRHLAANDVSAFSQEIMDRAGRSGSLDDLNKWLHLAMNIWNTTPQADRGGKSAYELSRRHRR